MDRTELSEVAWELIEHCRPWLTDVEANTAFVLLGIGEYGEALVLGLRSVAAAADLTLPEALLDRLNQLPHTHFVDDEFVSLLGELTEDFPQAG